MSNVSIKIKQYIINTHIYKKGAKLLNVTIKFKDAPGVSEENLEISLLETQCE